MSVPAGDARNRLPREPYPGLRPFLDFEAALLFGRERQVREVIEHLKATQFVAVLGGSGSGKSSLIQAGVVPELRSFGIPGAGDLWLPLTCTPGTNVSAADREARKHTPVTRLARRFAGLLKPAATPDAAAQRIADIAEVFRQESGFARLLDTYGDQLDIPPGPDPAEARVLFVVDQFEEIFHPTNKGVADATLLVERVLDHFFNPHPRCHVVLTMRSEHLNDCATFLELPDAINKSSYLIRRLDDDELRAAIVGPAQRFLRLVARSEPGAAPGTAARALPAEVQFEPAVLERLLRDVKALTHDPDHLPLLQHLLARLWGAALEREEMDVPVPAHITEIDLVRAVGAGTAGAAGDEQPLDERINTLRASVENWPESIYRWQGPAQRAQLDALFRRLAFKDPNTGLYSQQRIDVDVAARLLGEDATRVELRALLSEGFLGSVDYLFWDDDDATRVTLKVSHESFIRGWARFRELADRESEHFEEFMGVLRKSADWQAHGRGEDFLLEIGEWRRLRDSGFESRIAQAEQRQTWGRFLLLDRDGARLVRAEPQLDAFLASSSRRLRERESRAGRSRRNWLLLGAATLLLLPSSMFSVLIQAPVTERAELLFDAGNRANRAPLTPDYPGVGTATVPLFSLLRAAELIDDARTGRSFAMARASEWLLTHLAWISAVRRQDAFLSGVAAQAEPPVNGKLRALLTSAVWRGAPPATGAVPMAMPQVSDAECRSQADPSDGRAALRGRLFVADGPSAERLHRRALLVPAWSTPRDSAITVLAATWDAATQSCLYGPVAISVPLYLEPALVFDAGLRYLVYATGQAGSGAVTVQEFDWDRVEDGSARHVQSHTRAVVTGADALARVQRAAGPERLAVVPAWRSTAGRTLDMAGELWRMVAPSAQGLQVAPDDPQFKALAVTPADSACALLGKGWPLEPGLRLEIVESPEHCYAITRGNVGDVVAGAAATASRREQLMVAVYERPEKDALARLAENPPAPIASWAPYARASRSESAWMVGIGGEYAGWLALRGRDLQGQERLIGGPASTCALWRLGRQVQAATDAAAEGACSGR